MKAQVELWWVSLYSSNNSALFKVKKNLKTHVLVFGMPLSLLTQLGQGTIRLTDHNGVYYHIL
jgi:hypothetical protein